MSNSFFEQALKRRIKNLLLERAKVAREKASLLEELAKTVDNLTVDEVVTLLKGENNEN